MNSLVLGRRPALSRREENNIVEAIKFAADFGIPFTKHDLCAFVQGYLNRKGIRISMFTENLPGSDWVHSFLRRHKQDLSVRLAEKMKRCRTELNEELINSYFNEPEMTLADVPPTNLLNYDETNMCHDPGQERVLVRKATKHAKRTIDSSKISCQ